MVSKEVLGGSSVCTAWEQVVEKGSKVFVITFPSVSRENSLFGPSPLPKQQISSRVNLLLMWPLPWTDGGF